MIGGGGGGGSAGGRLVLPTVSTAGRSAGDAMRRAVRTMASEKIMAGRAPSAAPTARPCAAVCSARIWASAASSLSRPWSADYAAEGSTQRNGIIPVSSMLTETSLIFSGDSCSAPPCPAQRPQAGPAESGVTCKPRGCLPLPRAALSSPADKEMP